MTSKVLYSKVKNFNIFILYFNKLKCYTLVLFYTRKHSKKSTKPINLDIKETPENISIILPKPKSLKEIEDESHKYINGIKRYYLIRNKSYCILCRHNKTSEYIYTRLIPPHPFNHLILLIIALLHISILVLLSTNLANLILSKTQLGA